jgi:GT2 family glycosyltransferase
MSVQHLMGRVSNRLRTYADNLLLTKKGRTIEKVKARKAARAASPYIYTDSPAVSLVLQSFNHRDNIERIVDRLRLTVADELIVCEDGSIDGSEQLWRRLLVRPNDFLIQSNDLHEIRTYNRAISLARGEFVGVLQDDDIPPENPRWVADVITLFRKYPKLAILGCWNSWKFNNFDDFEHSIGSPVGAGDHLSADCDLSLREPESKLPFQFVEAVGIGPMFFRRADFEALGGFDLQLSQPGEPGIWLDYDICLRAWLSGRHVGVYESEAFDRHIGGQGTVMFTGSKRYENFQKNLKYVQRTFGNRFDLVRSTVKDLNQELLCRSHIHF